MAPAPAEVHIGVLLGAGPRLSPQTRARLKSLLREVFEHARMLLAVEPPKTVLDLARLAEALTKRLEDSDATNAGRGSELSLTGSVECDATMAVSSSEHGDLSASCGAVPDLLNPISLCYELVKQQLDASPRARSVPNFLVSDGAREYGLRLGLCRGNLATRRAEETRQKYLQATSADEPDRYVDTVGLILVAGSTVCVCSSSGGPILKDPGRVGPAGIVGCGSFCSAHAASVCSGFGEDITATRLAQVAACSDRDLGEVLRGPWSQRLQRTPPYFGVVKATVDAEGAVFEWDHTTEGMVCGFARVGANSCAQRLVASTEPQGGGVRL